MVVAPLVRVVGEEVIEELEELGGAIEEPEAEDAAEEPVVPVDPVVEPDSELVVDIIVVEVIVVDIMEAEVLVPEDSAVVGRVVGPIMQEDMHIS